MNGWLGLINGFPLATPSRIIVSIIVGLNVTRSDILELYEISKY